MAPHADEAETAPVPVPVPVPAPTPVNQLRLGSSASPGVKSAPHPAKPRMGARGQPKVKSGCRTCKIRHKKCDEARPSCYQCTSTNRQCDFLSASVPRPYGKTCVVVEATSQPPNPKMGNMPLLPKLPDYHHRRLSSTEVNLFDYFRNTCAPEFSLYFDSELWERLILQVACAESFAFHAALATSALSWNHYCPGSAWTHPGGSVSEYATTQYNCALRVLNRRLADMAHGARLALLGCMLFINIDFLQMTESSQSDQRQPLPHNLVSIHLNGGRAILQSLKRNSDSWYSYNGEAFELGFRRLQNQLDAFVAMEKGKSHMETR